MISNKATLHVVREQININIKCNFGKVRVYIFPIREGSHFLLGIIIDIERLEFYTIGNCYF